MVVEKNLGITVIFFLSNETSSLIYFLRDIFFCYAFKCIVYSLFFLSRMFRQNNFLLKEPPQSDRGPRKNK